MELITHYKPIQNHRIFPRVTRKPTHLLEWCICKISSHRWCTMSCRSIEDSMVGFHFGNGWVHGGTTNESLISSLCMKIEAPERGRGGGTRHEEARSSWRIQLLITLLMVPLVHGPTTKFNTCEVYYSSGGHACPRTWGGQPQEIKEDPLNWILVIIKRSTGIQWLTKRCSRLY